MRIKLVVALSGLAAVLGTASCGSGDGGGGGGTPTSNNAAVLTGAAIGGNGAPISELRRTVPVELVEGGTLFRLGDANMSRLDTGTDAGAYLAIPITNISGVLRCFVEADDVSWLDSSGTALESGFSYALGSTYQSQSVATNTCLQPGETGYLLDVVATPGRYAETVRVKVTMGEDDTDGWKRPAAVVRPTGYRVEDAAGAGRLTIDFSNTGTEAAVVADGFHRYIILDASMTPQHWSFATNDVMPATELVPGTAGSATHASANTYAGQGTVIQAYIDFDVPSLTAWAPGASPANQTLFTRLRAVRDARLRQQARDEAVISRSRGLLERP